MGDIDYRLRVESRREVVSSLFVHGLTKQDIRRAMNLSEESIRNDLRHIGSVKIFFSRPCGKRASFQSIIQFYAQLVTGMFSDMEEDLKHNLCESIAKWIEEEKTLDFLNGVEVAMDILLALGYSSETEGYASLLGSLFGVKWRVFPADLTASARRELWHEYLHDVAEGKIVSIPASRVELKHALAIRHVAVIRAQILPVLSDTACAKIDEQLSTLTPREQQVVRRRFGIGERQKDIQGIADDLDVTPNRVRQLVSHALHKLGQPGRGLRDLIQTVGGL